MKELKGYLENTKAKNLSLTFYLQFEDNMNNIDLIESELTRLQRDLATLKNVDVIFKLNMERIAEKLLENLLRRKRIKLIFEHF